MNNTSDTPLVGIGLPIYNDGTYLEPLLKSIVQQRYHNLILYICDNGSTDNTEEICRSYSNNYHLINYKRYESTVAASVNWKRVYDMAASDEPKYFMFTKTAATLSSNLIDECVQMLEANPEAVLAYPSVKWIDKDYAETTANLIGYYDSRGTSPIERAIFSIWGRREQIFGLMRYEQINSVRFDLNIIGHDYVVLLELSMLGSFCYVPNADYYRVNKYTNESYHDRFKRYRSRIFLKTSKFDRWFPIVRLPYHLVKSVVHSGLGSKQKLLIILLLLLNAPFRYITKKGKNIQ